MPIHELKVEPENSQLRLDLFLAQNLPDAPSRSFAKKLIDAGHVTVNKAVVKAKYKVVADDAIHIEIPDGFLRPEHVEPENIPLDIFYEDEDMLVINKPAGMLVHPAHGCSTGTLVNALLNYCDQLSDCNTALRPGIVHRLDQDTSGLIVIAKDNQTHMKLARQFQKHTVKKRYVALVEGEVEFDEGVIDAPLGRHYRHREKRDVQFNDSAKIAVTYYRVIKRFKGVTLMALFPRTGRTHQLRVHMVHIRHPILGDDKYGKKQSFPRLALHAQAIGFHHPRKKCFMEFSLRPPKEFLTKVGL